MKVTIRDENVLRAIQPQQLAFYLRARGWSAQEWPGRPAVIWRKSDGSEEFEVLVPLESSLGDFASRMHDALKTLEEVEQRSQSGILRDITISTAECLRIPATRANLRDGPIFLKDGPVVLPKRSGTS